MNSSELTPDLTDETHGRRNRLVKPRPHRRLVGIILFTLTVQVFISYALITRVLFPEAQGDPRSAKSPIGNVFLIPELVVNPAGEEARPRYLRCGFGLEVSDQQTLEEIEQRRPQVLDALIRLLSAKRLVELDSPEEIERLRAQIRDQVNSRMIAGEVTNVYLTDFVVQ